MTSEDESQVPGKEPVTVEESSPSDTASTSQRPKSWEKPGLLGSIRRGLRSFQRYVWDDPDKSAEDKRFLLKLDFFLLTSACLGYFSKNLDQANVSNAYVSGVSLLDKSHIICIGYYHCLETN